VYLIVLVFIWFTYHKQFSLANVQAYHCQQVKYHQTISGM